MVPTLQGPEVVVGPIPRTNLQTDNTQPLDTASYTRSTLEFPCNGDTCEAWLYMPKGIGGARPPVVIMGHGMGGQKVGELVCSSSSCQPPIHTVEAKLLASNSRSSSSIAHSHPQEQHTWKTLQVTRARLVWCV